MDCSHKTRETSDSRKLGANDSAPDAIAAILSSEVLGEENEASNLAGANRWLRREALVVRVATVPAVVAASVWPAMDALLLWWSISGTDGGPPMLAILTLKRVLRRGVRGDRTLAAKDCAMPAFVVSLGTVSSRGDGDGIDPVE